MNSVYSEKKICSGCGICEVNCPYDAVKMKVDEEGFLYPVIDYALCVDCGKCRKICSFNRDFINKKKGLSKADFNKKVYVGRHLNKNIVAESRSGGVFSALSDMVLNRGGAICGVVLDEKNIVKHIISERAEDRDLMRGSKYTQSFISREIWSDIKERLTRGQDVLFTGTSCQVAALKRFLGNSYSNLICLDIICHGVVSPLIFDTYIKTWEEKLKSKCLSINFREKKHYGWSAHVERLFLQDNNGKEYFVDSTIYRDLFYGHMTLRPSCYVCPYKSLDHPGDITIGDCWGIEKVDHAYADDLGCSIVFINTSIGDNAFNLIKDCLDVKKINLCEELLQQPLTKPFEVDEMARNDFWQDFYTLDKSFVLEKYGNGKFEKDVYMTEKVDKRSSLEVAFQVLDKIMCMFEEGISISYFFEDNRINTVAIYGFGKMGRHLYYLLKNAGINVEYAIDKHAENIENVDIQVFHPEDDLKKVDAVIVTPAAMFYEIESELYPLIPDTYIISIETVVSYRR